MTIDEAETTQVSWRQAFSDQVLDFVWQADKRASAGSVLCCFEVFVCIPVHYRRLPLSGGHDCDDGGEDADATEAGSDTDTSVFIFNLLSTCLLMYPRMTSAEPPGAGCCLQ